MPWYYYLILILSGGAFGAIITLLIKKYQGRIQPVSRSIRLIRVFGSMSGTSSLNAKLVVEKDDEEFKYDNLYIASVSLTNTGNKDYRAFEIGITLPENVRIVHADNFAPDRHHSITQKTVVELGKTVNEIDYELGPFNRKDTYQIDLHCVLSSHKLSTSDFEMSTAHPINFVDKDQSVDVAVKLLTAFIRATT